MDSYVHRSHMAKNIRTLNNKGVQFTVLFKSLSTKENSQAKTKM